MSDRDVLPASSASTRQLPGLQLLTYAGIFLTNLIIYPLSKLTPRDPSLWAFGAHGGRFEGNSKYLFLWAHSHAPGISCVWITESPELARALRQRGYKAYSRWSWTGLTKAARAGLYFYNDTGGDVSFGLSAGARRFNLWHGIGLKNVNRGAKIGYQANLKAKSNNPFMFVRNMRRFQRSDWILATSEGTAGPFFGRCFGLETIQAPVLGYPRLDPIVDKDMNDLARSFEDYSSIDKAFKDYPRRILYVPTLRTDDKNLLSDSLPDISRLSNALERQNAVLLLKLHPKTQVQKGWTNALPDNIRILPKEMDIYPVLDKFDALITDYSSLFFEYILFSNSGMMLYPFDYDRYVANDRDLAWDYDEATIGVRVNNFDQFCAAIEDGQVFAPMDPAKLKHLRTWFWDGDASPQPASARIVDFARKQLAC